MISLIFHYYFFEQDCHGIGGENDVPAQDDTQNFQIEEGFQNATHTQIQFRRSLQTCDPHDIAITVSNFLSKSLFFGSHGQNLCQHKNNILNYCRKISFYFV